MTFLALRRLSIAGAVVALMASTFNGSALAGKIELSRRLVKSSKVFAIDCYDSNVKNADTNNTLTVKFWNNSKLLGQDIDVPTCNLAKDAVYSVDTAQLVTHVTVEIGGGNALWIDEARLGKVNTYSVNYEISTDTKNGIEKSYETDTKLISVITSHWGRDGGKGYCVSTDAEDNRGAWENIVDGRGCFREFSFKQRLQEVSAVGQSKNNIDYKLDIFTGTKRGAGTDSNVFVQEIIGSQKTISPNERLNSKISGNPFENGDQDTVTLSQLEDVGNVTAIKIKTDGRYSGSNWQLNKIVVTSNGQAVTLDCKNVWLNGSSTTCKR